jgi:pimeloyl-ACP methyl ester carboxylesterase
LHLERPVAVGHSLGGGVATYAEIQAPGTFSGLVLVDPAGIGARTDEARARSAAMAERARKRRAHWVSRQEMFESYRPREPFNTWREDVLRLYVNWSARASRERGVVLKCSGEVEAQVYENAGSLDTFERLTAINCPTLVLRGERSEAVPQGLADVVAARLPNGRLITVPGASHFLPMEKPDAVAQQIKSFIERSPSTSSG